MGPGILGLESEKTSFSKINTSEGFFLKDDDDDDDGKAWPTRGAVFFL